MILKIYFLALFQELLILKQDKHDPQLRQMINLDLYNKKRKFLNCNMEKFKSQICIKTTPSVPWDCIHLLFARISSFNKV